MSDKIGAIPEDLSTERGTGSSEVIDRAFETSAALTETGQIRQPSPDNSIDISSTVTKSSAREFDAASSGVVVDVKNDQSLQKKTGTRNVTNSETWEDLLLKFEDETDQK